MKRGEVVWAQLPKPAASPGHEQFGRRPAIVLQDEPALAELKTVVVVPVTSVKSALRFPNTYPIQPTTANGLAEESIALAHQIRALDKRRVDGVIGTLSPEDLSQVEARVRAQLRLP